MGVGYVTLTSGLQILASFALLSPPSQPGWFIGLSMVDNDTLTLA